MGLVGGGRHGCDAKIKRFASSGWGVRSVESIHLRTSRARCEKTCMDESIELFKAEQNRLAEGAAPPRSLTRQITTQISALGAFAIIVWVLMAGLGALPRNPDNSIKLIYFGPALVVLAAIAALFLRKDSTKRSPFRLAAWGLIALAVVAIPAGAIDLLTRNGS